MPPGPQKISNFLSIIPTSYMDSGVAAEKKSFRKESFYLNSFSQYL
jgi:hypothetical protein